MSAKDGLKQYNRFLDGDTSALEELLLLYGDALVRFAYCFVSDAAAAEDVVEDALATLIFRRRRFSERENFRAYLYKTVRNKCIDYLRFHRRKIPLSDVENVLIADDIQTDAATKVRNETLYRCLQRLATQYRQVLYLVYFEEYKPEQAGKILKKTSKQTYNLLARAKTALRELLEKEGITGYENE